MTSLVTKPALSRTKLIFKNIAFSFVWKVGSGGLSYLLIPLVMAILGKEQFGVWTLLSGFYSWVVLFDFGVLNAFRNKFTESLALGNKCEAQEWFNSALFSLCAILIGLFLVFSGLIYFADLSHLFNISEGIQGFKSIVFVSFLLVLFRFLFSIINVSMVASQKSSFASFFDFMGSALGILLVLIFKNQVRDDLLMVTVLTLAGPVLSLLLAFVVYVLKNDKVHTLAKEAVSRNKVKYLFSTGASFLAIQLALLFLFSSGQFLVTHYLGPIEAGKFAIVSKYFNVLIIVFSVVLAPIWTGFSEARVKKDLAWINLTIKRLLRLWLVFLLIASGLVLFYEFIFNFWLGAEYRIPLNLVLWTAVFTLVQLWIFLFGNFINSTGSIKLQTYLLIFSALLFFPLSIYLIKVLGVSGVLIGGVIAMIPEAILLPLQTYRLVETEGNSIWHQ